MPRKQLKPTHRVEHLSILNEKGKLDQDIEPDLSDKLLRKLYRAMVRGRQFDRFLLTLQRQGRIGTFAPIEGQEAAQIGPAAALRSDDWMVPSFRETGAALWRGVPLDGILLYNAGYNEGAAVPDDQFTLPIAVPVASQLPHAVGISYALKLRGSDKVVMTFFGDGATSEGDFHEALNFAAVYGTPTIFVCQNNQWAISLPRDQQTRSKSLAQKSLAYAMPGIQVDGNDILATYAAAAEAVERARNGDGPTLIECVTYRMGVHTTADDPSRYRSDEDVEKWHKRDPIDRFRTYLKKKKLLSDSDIEELELQIEKEIEDAWENAQSQMEEIGAPKAMFDHVYATLPPYLERQRAAFSSGKTGGGS